MKPQNSLFTVIVLTGTVVAVIGALFFFGKNSAVNPNYSQMPLASSTPSSATPTTGSNPSSFSLPIPFTPQAPTGNWDQLHNEACEEASAIMAAAYFSGDRRTKIPAAEVESRLTALTNWEQAHFGYSLDTTTAETAETIRLFYNLKADVVSNYTEKDIKDALNANKVVIIPVNGRKIGNPNYKPPGPIYHMLVIRGYTATQIITNDSGTRNGENYKYLFSTLRNAAADWNHATGTIDESKSLIIIVSK